MAAVGGRVSHAEARHVRDARERLAVRNGDVDEASWDASEGIGVRVRVGGAWGFAATRDVSRAGAEDALLRAVQVARAQPAAPALPRAPVEPAHGSWRSPAERDPFEVRLEHKAGMLLAADR